MAYKFTKLVPEGSSGGGGAGETGFTFTIGADGDFSRLAAIAYLTVGSTTWSSLSSVSPQGTYQNVVAVYYSMYSDGGFSSVTGKYAAITYSSTLMVPYTYAEVVNSGFYDGSFIAILKSDLTINNAYNDH